MRHFFNDNTQPAPLTEAEQKLNEWGIKYKRKADGTLVVRELNISSKNLTRLPDLGNVIVRGDFICQNNRLTSLVGSPKSVGRGFYCDGNKLPSLIGAPQSVPGYFSCNSNPLTSLVGAPRKFARLSCNLGDFYAWEAIPAVLRQPSGTSKPPQP
ncbi:MAG: hypothetical protein KGL10_09050 [Alphaproteobacteria bacterium]|nr:hypothetical protein [Alphaproteobacteria bacterium]